MKKQLAAILCLTLASMSFAGCSVAEAPAGAAQPAAAEETPAGEDSQESEALHGKLVMMTNSSGGTYDAVEEIVNRFMELNPDVEIEFSTQGSDYESLMKAKMAANDLPDVFATHGWSVARYSEYLIPLNDEPWFSSLDPEVLPVISDEDGAVYTLPLNVDKAGMIYNTAILEELGEEVPTDWEAFTNVCEKAKNAGYTPIYLAGKDAGKTAGVLNILLNSFLAAPSDNAVDALKSGNIEEDLFVPTFSFLTDLRDNGFFNVDYVTADPSGIPEKLASGQVLFALESNATMADAYNLNPDATLSMMPVPAISQDEDVFLTGGEKEAYGIWKDSENIELAKALLDFMAQPENIEKVSAASGMPVSMTNAVGNLGRIQESFDRYNDIRVLNKFDRECFPNGMWSTMKTVGTSLIAGDVDAEKASEMFYVDYKSLFAQQEQ